MVDRSLRPPLPANGVSTDGGGTINVTDPATQELIGQTCVYSNRIYAQAGIHDSFVERLAEAVDGLRVGNGMDQARQLGPLINDARCCES
jgi:hypothetical protein